MNNNRKLTPEQEHAIVLAKQNGELGKDLAVKYGVDPSTITHVMRRQMQRLTKRKVSEITFLSAYKLGEAVQKLDMNDKDDRKFALEAFKVGADRDGLSPQAISLQMNQNLGVSVQVQPLLAAGEADTIRELLKGSDE